MRRRMVMRGKGRCIFAMMSEEKWSFVCGERGLGDGSDGDGGERRENISSMNVHLLLEPDIITPHPVLWCIVSSNSCSNMFPSDLVTASFHATV
jgi:hypothetical protein